MVATLQFEQVHERFRWTGFVEVLFKGSIVMMFPYWNQSYLALMGGDSGAMAVHYGLTRVIQSVIHLVVFPLTSTLSDTVGRKHLMTWGRLGTAAFMILHRFRDRSPAHRLWMEQICWPLSNACWPVFAASHSDLFADRPELSAQIQAADGLWVNVVGISGGVRARPERPLLCCCPAHTDTDTDTDRDAGTGRWLRVLADAAQHNTGELPRR